MFKGFLIDRKYRLPRIWSNNELKKFSHLFAGDVVNVSGWKDKDKEGNSYSGYFVNANNYYISNYKSEARGLQGFKNEFYLDLTQDLDEKYAGRFDVVFNHTTLEHIYDVRKAFKNLCLMSRDIVIIVVPFMQQMHSGYGDYWRFTPLTVRNLFEDNGMKLLYLNFNNHKHASVYIFAIGSREPEKWQALINNEFGYKCEGIFLDKFESYIGCRAITNSWLSDIFQALRRII